MTFFGEFKETYVILLSLALRYETSLTKASIPEPGTPITKKAEDGNPPSKNSSRPGMYVLNVFKLK
jgi:hypothetical protein